MIENEPLVSVIIPVYNCEQYLAEAIDSVLAQTYHSIEIIVIDDGSTDGSSGVARRFASVQYCFQQQGGIGAARNLGIESAHGSFLAFLDADDRWVENKLELQMKVLDQIPELDFVLGQARQLHSAEWGKGIREKSCPKDQLMPGYVAGTMLIRRDSFQRVGRFKTDCQVGEFMDWCLRARESDLIMKMLPELVLWRRLHQTNQGILQRKARTDYASVLKASLDRRRAAAGKS
jgi:glycosyltransferase involved in cell wall biosynthesis